MQLDGIIENEMLIFGLTEVFKHIIPEKHRSNIAPMLATVLGAFTHVYLYTYSPENVVYGAFLGMSAAGVYKAAMRFAPEKK